MSEATRTEIPGFGTHMLAIFLTPIYYGMRGKWGAFVVTAILYFLSAITMPIFGLGMVFWIIAAAPTAWTVRNEIMTAHAKRTGEETAAAIVRANREEASRTAKTGVGLPEDQARLEA